MADDIKFGTDGWRGRIAENYTFANVRRCAQGFAEYLLARGHAGEAVVVGYDKRFSSEHFAAAAAEVLAGNGLHVWLTDSATPTPVISYSVVNKGAVAAVNITASHNPPEDNGFKVRDHTGGAIAPAGLNDIEARIPATAGVKSGRPANSFSSGTVAKFDPAPAYIEHIHKLVDVGRIKDAGFKVLVDAMWGNGAGWFPRLLEGGRTQVIEIHDVRNPVFPEMSRPEPIPPNIDAGLRATAQHGADVCLITDGDADRLGIGDENGAFVNQLRVYGLLAYYLLEVRGARGPIVKTLSTTTLLNRLGALYDVPVYETGVGFKYVAPKMTETDALIGGEESGGYAFRDNVPERDGILAGLYFLDLMCRTEQKPTQLLETLFERVGTRSYYDRIDSTFAQDQKDAIRARVETTKPDTIGGLRFLNLDTTDGFKFNLEGGSWLLVRFSGTEPIIRVYCETDTEARVQPILQDGLRIAGLA
ncbi:MAG: phosphoglucomutase/phosphomannomutase family protein [Anaerolineales bacterium]